MLIEKVVNCIALLKSKKKTVAFAEGASNGSIFEAFSSFANADAVSIGGMVAAQDHMKDYFFGIEKEILNHYGSESAEVAQLMAHNLSDYLDATIYISITGAPLPNPIFKKENQKDANPIYLHLIFPDAQVSEQLAFSCTDNSMIDQTLARVCELIKNKLHFKKTDALEVA